MNIICVKKTKLYRRQINIPYHPLSQKTEMPEYTLLIRLYSNQYPSSHKIIKQRASRQENTI